MFVVICYSSKRKLIQVLTSRTLTKRFQNWFLYRWKDNASGFRRLSALQDMNSFVLGVLCLSIQLYTFYSGILFFPYQFLMSSFPDVLSSWLLHWLYLWPCSQHIVWYESWFNIFKVRRWHIASKEKQTDTGLWNCSMCQESLRNLYSNGSDEQSSLTI